MYLSVTYFHCVHVSVIFSHWVCISNLFQMCACISNLFPLFACISNLSPGREGEGGRWPCGGHPITHLALKDNYDWSGCGHLIKEFPRSWLQASINLCTSLPQSQHHESNLAYLQQRWMRCGWEVNETRMRDESGWEVYAGTLLRDERCSHNEQIMK